MSESEQRGRCRQQLEAWFANNISFVPRYSWMIADAIDRLAADVAAVMEMTQEIALRVPSEFGQDACDAAVRVALKERDAAVRERDEARAIAADVAAVKAKVDAISPEDVAHLLESEKAWVMLVEEQRDAAIRERDEARAEVEKMRMQLAACGVLADCNTTDSLERNRRMNPDYDCASVQSVIRAVEREIGLRAEVERLNAELARAGSPPVVEVPAISRRDVPMQNEAFAYRDALDAAGVKWKEVGRE